MGLAGDGIFPSVGCFPTVWLGQDFGLGLVPARSLYRQKSGFWYMKWSKYLNTYLVIKIS